MKPVAEREIPSQKTAPCQLQKECRLVTGAKRAAIYDLEKGNVYSLNEAAREIISGSPDKFGFWERVNQLGLAEASPAPLSSDIEAVPQVGLEFIWLPQELF